MLRPSFQRRMPPTANACAGGAVIPSMNIMPLTRCTSRSPATPVPYSFQQRQRAKMLGSKARLGTVPCQVSQSRVCGDRSGGGGYCHAPVGLLRPSQPSTSIRSPIIPCAISSLTLAQICELTRQRVAAVVEVAGRGALDPRQRDGVRQQAGPLHADADDAEAHAVAGGNGGNGEGLGSERGAGDSGAQLQEFTARPIVGCHGISRGRWGGRIM